MNVHVNENCIGCGLCVNLCGSVVLMTEEGAAESCPVNAIEILHH